MKKWMVCLIVIGACIFAPAWALEADVTGEAGAIEKGTPLEERLARLEAAVGIGDPQNRWLNRIHIGGLIEVEAGYERITYNNSDLAGENNSDVDLSTVELSVDVDIAAHVIGHVLFKYEEDDLSVDEGFITLNGTEAFPAYLIAGRQYLPFGTYNSHFVSDPNTLVLGETNEGAAVAGYRFGGELVDLSVGVFNSDDQRSWVAAVAVQPMENLTVGLSYTSNLAASTGLNEVCTNPEQLSKRVSAVAAFAEASCLERFTLIGEYISAVDHFKAGELYYPSDSHNRKPSAWNFEIGAQVTEKITLAARYGGSRDGAEFLPEIQYGTVARWECFANTTLALEYLRAKFETDDMTTDTVIAQLAVSF